MPMHETQDNRTEPDFREIFESVPGLYLILDPDLGIVAVSEAYLRATKTCRAEILGRKIFEVFPDNPDDAAATGVANLKASLGRVLALRRLDAMAVQKYDIRRPEAEGGGFEERFWSPTNSPILGPDGGVRYILHRVEDVTDYMRLLQQSRQQDEAAEKLKTRAGQMEAEIYLRAQELQEANGRLRALQATLEARVEERTAELLQANDRLLHSEEQLRHAQKMEAVGRLAGGIAHDFNNLLTVIVLLGEELQATAGAGPELTAMLSAAQRGALLVRQLLAFSRQQVMTLKSLDFREVLDGMSEMLNRALGEDIDLNISFAPDLRRFFGDPGQIDQVLLNLAINSRDAMPAGGALTIEASNVDLDAEYAGEHPDVAPGPHVMLAVSDTGLGMDKATQARAFDPFFTTKAPGKGTGLGLATVFGIVKQCGGHIWLYSEPGVGTTFKLYFHAAPSLDGAAVAPLVDGAPQATGHETILLVEDDAPVRAATREILAGSGYTVLEARSGKEAMTLLSQRAGGIDLLLTDVIMPEMNGRLVSELARSFRPDLPVLFVSGYTDDAILRHGILDQGVPFLQKPFTPAQLRQKIREVLTAPA